MKLTLPAQSTRQHAILAAVCLAALSLPLTFSGGAVATPAIGADFGGSPVAMNWVTNAFMLTFGSLLMAAGALADRFGRKRLFVYGVGGFALTSLGLGFAPTMLAVDLLRGAQGVGAAAALAGGSAALAQEFDGPARTRAFSLLGTAFGVGLAFGPVLAGGLIAAFGWRAIFAAGALTGALSLALGAPRMQESKNPQAHKLDLAGMVSFTVALTCFTSGVIEAPALGWTSCVVEGLLAAFVVFAALFIAIEMRTEHAMLDLTLFRYPRFVGVQVLPIATCYCYIVLLVVLPLRFIGFDGDNPLQAGVTMLALSSPMLCVPLIAGKLTRWLSSGVICGIGLLIAAVGVFTLGIAFRSGSTLASLPPMLAIGIGAGLPWGLMDGLSISVVPKARAGMATGIFSTTRVAGEGIALVSVTALLAALLQQSLAQYAPQATPSALTAVAGRLANGDISGASVLLPSVTPAALRVVYREAFGQLLNTLAVITLVCAMASIAFLGTERKRGSVGQSCPRTTVDRQRADS